MAAFSGKSGIAIESDRSEDELRPRVALEIALLSLKDEGVRSLLIRLPFTVHGEGRFGFVPFYVDKSKKLEFAGYVDDGSNHWPAVNVEDAAELYKLVLEKGKAGSVYHGVAEEGIPFNQIAAQTAEGLNVPTKSLLTEEAVQDYQWLARFLSMGVQASSEITQKELGWKPTHGTLFDDIKNHYVE